MLVVGIYSLDERMLFSFGERMRVTRSFYGLIEWLIKLATRGRVDESWRLAIFASNKIARNGHNSGFLSLLSRTIAPG